MKTVIGQLQSGGNIIHGVLKTLGERESGDGNLIILNNWIRI